MAQKLPPIEAKAVSVWMDHGDPLSPFEERVLTERKNRDAASNARQSSPPFIASGGIRSDTTLQKGVDPTVSAAAISTDQGRTKKLDPSVRKPC